MPDSQMQSAVIDYLKSERDWIFTFEAAAELENLGLTGNWTKARANIWQAVIDELIESNEIEHRDGKIKAKKPEAKKVASQMELF